MHHWPYINILRNHLHICFWFSRSTFFYKATDTTKKKGHTEEATAKEPPSKPPPPRELRHRTKKKKTVLHLPQPKSNTAKTTFFFLPHYHCSIPTATVDHQPQATTPLQQTFTEKRTQRKEKQETKSEDRDHLQTIDLTTSTPHSENPAGLLPTHQPRPRYWSSPTPYHHTPTFCNP